MRNGEEGQIFPKRAAGPYVTMRDFAIDLRVWPKDGYFRVFSLNSKKWGQTRGNHLIPVFQANHLTEVREQIHNCLRSLAVNDTVYFLRAARESQLSSFKDWPRTSNMRPSVYRLLTGTWSLRWKRNWRICTIQSWQYRLITHLARAIM